MATIEICEQSVSEKRVRIDPLAPLRRVWQRLQCGLEERRVLHQLYQLDPHVLRDIGFDPEAIYRAREGAIGETDGHKYRRLD